MKNIYKEYQQSFLLEPTKLNRLLDKIHERLADHTHTALHDSFEAFLTGDRREEMTTLEDVLALDNSRKHKVERLIILCSAATHDAAKPEHEVQVDFGFPKTSSATPGGTTKVVTISVRSDAAAWASRTLSEVEEQVERTWLHYTRPTSWLLFLAVLLTVVLFVVVITSPLVSLRDTARSDSLWLQRSDVDRIEAMLREHPTLTDENLREIATMQLRNVLGLSTPPRPIPPPNQVARTLFLGVPLSVVLACVLVLVKTCYPTAVFLWGDEVDRYAHTMQRRKIIWNTIISVIVVGVLSKSLFEGLSGWLPR
jgi:hypothetical protein